MYKLIAMDVDDTLLSDQLTVSEETKAALKAAIDLGVTVTLATGRMYASAVQIAKQINLNVPIITYQGSLVKTLLEGKVLYERYVPTKAAVQIQQYCLQHGLHLQLYVDDLLYGMEDNEIIKEYSDRSKIPFIIEPDFNKLIDKPLGKMLIIDDPVKLDRVESELKALVGEEAHITKSKPHYLEITHKEGTKGHALRYMAEHLGCSMQETIAIGDSWNDHEMIEAAGLGVAMGNATDKLKAIADYVTLSNNEDGVRHVIEKFVLNR
ncbi:MULTISPECIES: Cof-type HAD-IIB family hydrolase [unclassified Paenibacillus]|uniref:Cof-type HAD-IIB family hydrolase n=1 Tax=unclassified Paenibacillus TaxID=185978 RepID=UPI002F3ECDA5